MAELSTLGGVIKTSYENEPDTNAFTDAERTKLASLSTVATSGAYADLTGKPTLSAAASSGSYNDLIAKPALDFVPLAQKGANSGVAPLDSAGLVPLVHLNVSGLSFKGAWNPSTNSPQLVDGSGSVGDFYKASVAGSANTGNGSFTYAVGDWVIYAGGTWQRLGSADAVAMVNGKIGSVTLTAADVGARPSSYVPAWSEVTGKPTLTNTVNGKSGTVTLAAADVGARPSSYVPTWNEVTGKPNVFTRRTGAISAPAILGVVRQAGALLSIPSGTSTRLTDYLTGAGFDPFAMQVSDGFVIPSGIARARVILNFSMDKFTGTGANRHIWAGIYRNDTVFGSGMVLDPGPATNPTINTVTFPINVTAGDNINVRVWHNNGSPLNAVFSALSNITVELFEA